MAGGGNAECKYAEHWDIDMGCAGSDRTKYDGSLWNGELCDRDQYFGIVRNKWNVYLYRHAGESDFVYGTGAAAILSAVLVLASERGDQQYGAADRPDLDESRDSFKSGSDVGIGCGGSVSLGRGELPAQSSVDHLPGQRQRRRVRVDGAGAAGTGSVEQWSGAE